MDTTGSFDTSQVTQAEVIASTRNNENTNKEVQMILRKRALESNISDSSICLAFTDRYVNFTCSELDSEFLESMILLFLSFC